MNTIKQGIIGTAVLLVAAHHTFAIEGLKLSLQCSNVVLSWPSVEGETYIVQYRPTLVPGTPWGHLRKPCFLKTESAQRPMKSCSSFLGIGVSGGALG